MIGKYEHLSEMVYHLYSDDDMTKKYKITAVPTAFSYEGAINKPPKYSASKRHYIFSKIVQIS